MAETHALDRLVTLSATEAEDSDQSDVVRIDICNDWISARDNKKKSADR